MSGIAALFNLDGKPVEPHELRDMTSLLRRRGPDGEGTWVDGPIGLGNTLLATTSESLLEAQPLLHPPTGCVITADARVDNRDELIDQLGLRDRASVLSDAGVILYAYLQWDEACPEHLLGDFAFAIWDPRHQRLFCARDQMGMRPFYYHHPAGQLVAIASEPKAILVLPQTPYRINEVRIADFLVDQLEGVDKTSTFFEEVFRLPPAHTLVVTTGGVRQRRYWWPEPGPELKLGSDAAYAEAFLNVFTEAVQSRLRTNGRVGSMLSGGMDSGAVVAVASRLLAKEGRCPLVTFSGVSPKGDTEPETRAIRASSSMPNLEPHFIDYGQLGDLLPDLQRLRWDCDEPFDVHMTLPRAMYLAAHQRGLKVLLDGVAGDVLLDGEAYLARHLRTGHWVTAAREVKHAQRFWGEGFSSTRATIDAAQQAFLPDFVRRVVRPPILRRRSRRVIDRSIISSGFAARTRTAARLQAFYATEGTPESTIGLGRALNLDHANLTVGRERYERVGSAAAIEARDPFLDLRVIDFALRLPGQQLVAVGWPKVVLRRAMGGLLPGDVCWRAGKEHLGWDFTTSVNDSMLPSLRRNLEEGSGALAAFADLDAPERGVRSFRTTGVIYPGGEPTAVYTAVTLSSWLNNNRARPTPTRSESDNE